MYAIPLVARGRGVAVMYVDYGASGLSLNVEALETLVRIAGLTVELLAASHSVVVENREAGTADFEDTHHDDHVPAPVAEQAEEPAPEYDYQSETDEEAAPEFQAAEPAAEEVEEEETVGHHDEDTGEYESAEFAHAEEVVTADFAFGEAQSFESPAAEESFDDQGDHEETQPADGEAAPEDGYFEPAPEFQSEADDLNSQEAEGAMVFDSEHTPEGSPFETSAAEFEPAVALPATKPEASIEVSPSNTGYARLSDRPVDLPIEVPDDERRLHNDARRFARLLVSEIKLYNEKKVQEGRQARDLYERLREAIDRSREMYDKRVQPPVAAKFDYFHYELVNALADGEADRLGGGYPGSRI